MQITWNQHNTQLGQAKCKLEYSSTSATIYVYTTIYIYISIGIYIWAGKQPWVQIACKNKHHSGVCVFVLLCECACVCGRTDQLLPKDIYQRRGGQAERDRDRKGEPSSAQANQHNKSSINFYAYANKINNKFRLSEQKANAHKKKNSSTYTNTQKLTAHKMAWVYGILYARAFFMQRCQFWSSGFLPAKV